MTLHKQQGGFLWQKQILGMGNIIIKTSLSGLGDLSWQRGFMEASKGFGISLGIIDFLLCLCANSNRFNLGENRNLNAK